jgi:Fatty acid hydroxylase superfamily
MATAQEIWAASLVTGRRLKWKNAVTASICGAVPGLVAGAFIHVSFGGWLLGVLIGLLWSNAFEYFYHRYLLHAPKTSFGQGHLLHHLTTGTPQEPEHVTFGSSPLLVAYLFASNGSIALLLDWRLGLGIAPGILVGFSLYMIVVEEIHWRVHLGGWLPGIAWIREYHFAHHDIPGGRYNVFFPVFDFLFGNMQPPAKSTQAAAMARAVAMSYEPEESAIIAIATQIALWLWMVGMAIGARYFWTRVKA